MERAHFWSDMWSLGGTLVEWFTFQPLWLVPQGQSDLLKVCRFSKERQWSFFEQSLTNN